MYGGHLPRLRIYQRGGNEIDRMSKQLARSTTHGPSGSRHHAEFQAEFHLSRVSSSHEPTLHMVVQIGRESVGQHAKKRNRHRR